MAEEQTTEVTRERVETESPTGERQVVRESVAESSHPVQNIEHRKVHYYVYYIGGIIEILLGFRLMFKLLGANETSPFVNFIYTLSGIFEWPFRGIFRAPVTEGIETTAIFEPSTAVAMIVFAIIIWLIARYVEIKAVGKTTRES